MSKVWNSVPDTIIEGIGEDAIRCKNCGEPVTPFGFTKVTQLCLMKTINWELHLIKWRHKGS